MSATINPVRSRTRPATDIPTRRVPPLWVGFVVASLLALDVLGAVTWSIVVPLAAGTLWLGSTGWWRSPSITLPGALDGRDLAVIAVLYLAVVGLWRLAFTVFTADRWLGLFLCFGGGMLLGLAGPIVYTVWLSRRPLRSLGLLMHQLPATVAVGLLFAGVQAAVMLWGFDLPWASVAGFADVLGLMALVIWLAYRHSRALARGGKR